MKSNRAAMMNVLSHIEIPRLRLGMTYKAGHKLFAFKAVRDILQQSGMKRGKAELLAEKYPGSVRERVERLSLA